MYIGIALFTLNVYVLFFANYTWIKLEEFNQFVVWDEYEFQVK